MTETKQDQPTVRVEFMVRMNGELFEIGDAELTEGSWTLQLPAALRALADGVEEEIAEIEVSQ